MKTLSYLAGEYLINPLYSPNPKKAKYPTMKKLNSTKEGYINLFNSAKHSNFRYYSARGLPLKSCVIRAIGKKEVIQLSDIVKIDHRA